MSLSDFLSVFDDLVPGEHPVDDVRLWEMKIRSINKAIVRHNQYNPRIIFEDFASTGADDYQLSSKLTYWTDGFSILKSIRYPADDQEDGAIDWEKIEKPTGEFVYFPSAPQIGDDIRIEYTAKHTCTNTSCTISDHDSSAVQALAACFFCRMLSGVYALDQNSLISADSVNHNDRKTFFNDLAGKYCSEYYEHMGINPNDTSKVKAVGKTQDFDINYPWGDDRLTHSKYWR